MISKLFDYEALKKSEKFGVKNYKDSYYIGELDPDTSMRDGLGICVYNSQRIYEGSWISDKRDG